MPLNAGEWGVVIEKAKQDLDNASTLASAYDANATYPAGLPGVDKYKGTLAGAQRTTIRTDFVAVIDKVIAALQAARSAP